MATQKLASFNRSDVRRRTISAEEGARFLLLARTPYVVPMVADCLMTRTRGRHALML